MRLSYNNNGLFDLAARAGLDTQSTYEGRSINKLQNGIILLIFKI